MSWSCSQRSLSYSFRISIREKVQAWNSRDCKRKSRNSLRLTCKRATESVNMNPNSKRSSCRALSFKHRLRGALARKWVDQITIQRAPLHGTTGRLRQLRTRAIPNFNFQKKTLMCCKEWTQVNSTLTLRKTTSSTDWFRTTGQTRADWKFNCTTSRRSTIKMSQSWRLLSKLRKKEGRRYMKRRLTAPIDLCKTLWRRIKLFSPCSSNWPS
jgi:hypothetical protein